LKTRILILKNAFKKNNNHKLTDQDFENLGKMSDGFSGADLSILVRDALFEVIRELQRAKFFVLLD
jgi:vacuolar protein-sorting-associated protein 4